MTVKVLVSVFGSTTVPNASVFVEVAMLAWALRAEPLQLIWFAPAAGTVVTASWRLKFPVVAGAKTMSTSKVWLGSSVTGSAARDAAVRL